MAAPYNRKDHFYERAKEAGYRSRAAFKLLELSKRFPILARGNYILDLGAWPGSWLQVCVEKIGASGIAVGIDLQEIEDLKKTNATTIVGDAGDPANLQQALRIAGRRFDVVVSDLSPKLSGIREVDQARISGCGEIALNAVESTLSPGGHLVMKLFKGAQVEEVVRRARGRFSQLRRVELDATRATSNEFYIVGLGFKAAEQVDPES